MQNREFGVGGLIFIPSNKENAPMSATRWMRDGVLQHRTAAFSPLFGGAIHFSFKRCVSRKAAKWIAFSLSEGNLSNVSKSHLVIAQ